MDCNQDRLHKKSEELSGFAFVVVDSETLHVLVLPMYWCTVNRTFHRANPSTLKHFIGQFFSFPIVSYGVWDGESYKKIEYLSHI